LGKKAATIRPLAAALSRKRFNIRKDWLSITGRMSLGQRKKKPRPGGLSKRVTASKSASVIVGNLQGCCSYQYMEALPCYLVVDKLVNGKSEAAWACLRALPRGSDTTHPGVSRVFAAGFPTKLKIPQKQKRFGLVYRLGGP